MKFNEFSEGKLGAQTVARRMTAPNVTTIDNTAPWTRAQRAKAYKRTVDFNALKTDKEKFDFLYNLTAGKTSNRIVIPGPRRTAITASSHSNPMKIQSYNPATGEIELLHNHSTGDKEIYTGNVNNFKFLGRSRPSGNSNKDYTFDPGSLTQVSVTPGQTKRGRPTGPANKQYNFPKLPW